MNVLFSHSSDNGCQGLFIHLKISARKLEQLIWFGILTCCHIYCSFRCLPIPNGNFPLSPGNMVTMPDRVLVLESGISLSDFLVIFPNY